MTPSQRAEPGEVLKLGPPAAGEIVIVVDPGAGAAPFAAGTQTLRPGAQIPVHRQLDRDVALFVHKGQGRTTLGGRTTIVNPGAMWSVPRNTWFGVRNISNGNLQLAWVASPGLEAFFRDLSAAGASPTAQLLAELARRHRIELSSAAETQQAPAEPHRRGRRRGRRGRGGSTPPGVPRSAAPPPARHGASAPAPGAGTAPASAPEVSGAPHRRRRRRRGRRGRGPRPGAPQARRAPAAGPPSDQPQGSTPSSGRPREGRQRPGRGRPYRRSKEVYMGGQWVRVEGEGPAIAPGSSRSRPRHKSDEDDGPPGGPLTVPL